MQIVDVSDQADVDAVFDLTEECERKGKPRARQCFRRESADSLRQELTDTIIKQFGSQQQAPRMYPALMFRLCTKMCNHSDLAEDGFRPPFKQS